MNKEIWGVKAPKNKCTDKKCPFHGEINVKKGLFKGKVVKKDINRSATIEWARSLYVSKYERYEIRKSKMRVHNPTCVDAAIGQEVLVARTRPLSKVKNHVIIKVLSAEDMKAEVPKKKSVKKGTKKKEEKVENSKEAVEEAAEEVVEDAAE